jgi:hypothetical protein
MKTQLIIDTPPELSSTGAEVETVARADCDCPSVVYVPPHQNRENSSRLEPSSVPPDPSSLALAALPDHAVLAFNIRAFSPDGDCATPSHRRRVPHERKKQCGIFT